MKKGFKMVLLVILASLLLLFIAVIIFINTSPRFGAKLAGEELAKMEQSPNHNGGKFHNLVPTPMNGENSSMFQIMLKFIKGGGERVPPSVIPTIAFDREAFLRANNGISFAWFGHSTLLLNVEGKILLIDPVFSKRPSPVPFLGMKSFAYSHDFSMDELPEPDVILITHDHYDHLDYQTVLTLKDKEIPFLVPLGVAAHLIKWGVAPDRITELDWWDEYSFSKSLKLAATPTRHFSGRRINNRMCTLWCSWVIKAPGHTLFFCGDSGYGPHFKEIGEKYGPFDFNMLECGQYNEGWPYIHMTPEQTIQAHMDLDGAVMLPIHWGKFNLSLHAWYEPVKRLLKKAKSEQVKVVIPHIGEIVSLNNNPAQTTWWDN